MNMEESANYYNEINATYFEYDYDYEDETVDATALAVIHVILMLVGILCSTCLFIAVCRKKEQHQQVYGVVLVNMALAVLLFCITQIIKEVEIQHVSDHMTFTSLACDIVYSISRIADAAFGLLLIVLGLERYLSMKKEVLFNYKLFGIVSTVITWVAAIIVDLILLYGVGGGYRIYELYGGNSYCSLSHYSDLLLWCLMIFHYFIPAFVAAAFVIIFRIEAAAQNKPFQNDKKTIAFAVTALCFIILILPYTIIQILGMHYLLAGTKLVQIFITISVKLAYSVKIITCIIWLAICPELRSCLFCKGQNGGEKTHLLEKQ